VNDQVRALLRFWWVIVIGLAIAQVAAIMAVYNVDFSSIPPSLTQREQPSYTAEGRLLVSSGEEPYLRRAVTNLVQPPATADGPAKPVEVTQAPDTATLVQAANLYPLLIESDEVAKVREDLYGKTEGTLRAQAIFAISTPSRFTTSDVPVIQLKSVGDTPQQAIDLVNQTSTAFIRWMTDKQDKRRIKNAQRITVEPLQSPTQALAFGGSSSVLPVLVFGVVLMAFAALAIFLDRMFPRRRTSPAAAAEHRPEPAQTPV
jgi:hypothetical protein